MKEQTLEEVQYLVVEGLLLVAERMSAQEFKAFLIGGVVANVVGRLSDNCWEQICQHHDCGEKGCDCQDLARPLIKALDDIRNDRAQTLARRNN